jgi:hypothetical protein
MHAEDHARAVRNQDAAGMTEGAAAARKFSELLEGTSGVVLAVIAVVVGALLLYHAEASDSGSEGGFHTASAMVGH